MSIVSQRLASIFARTWRMLLLRGLAAIAFGVLTWLQPAISLAALVLLFGALLVALAFKARHFDQMAAQQ